MRFLLGFLIGVAIVFAGLVFQPAEVDKVASFIREKVQPVLVSDEPRPSPSPKSTIEAPKPSPSGVLTRAYAAQILNGAGRGYACQTGLTFIDGGFDRARTDGVLVKVERGYAGFDSVYRASDLPDGDMWRVSPKENMFEAAQLSRDKNKLGCLRGSVEVGPIADAPFAPGAGSYKVVEYVEVVELPAELEKMRPYVFTRYEKKAVFQKTDEGWRVANF